MFPDTLWRSNLGLPQASLEDRIESLISQLVMSVT